MRGKYGMVLVMNPLLASLGRKKNNSLKNKQKDSMYPKSQRIEKSQKDRSEEKDLGLTTVPAHLCWLASVNLTH